MISKTPSLEKEKVKAFAKMLDEEFEKRDGKIEELEKKIKHLEAGIFNE